MRKKLSEFGTLKEGENMEKKKLKKKKREKKRETPDPLGR